MDSGWLVGCDEFLYGGETQDKKMSKGRLPRVEYQQVYNTTLEATQGQMDGFLSQLPYKCHLEEVVSVGD